MRLTVSRSDADVLYCDMSHLKSRTKLEMSRLRMASEVSSEPLQRVPISNACLAILRHTLPTNESTLPMSSASAMSESSVPSRSSSRLKPVTLTAAEPTLGAATSTARLQRSFGTATNRKLLSASLGADPPPAPPAALFKNENDIL